METKYILSIPDVAKDVMHGHLRMGGSSPEGLEINANSLFFTKGDRPWLPVMGELHYSRYAEELWEEAILTMKACQIEIVASYLFWNHIEEIEGQFNWSGNRNLRRFVELCAEKGMYTFLRIGPWAHGEARNGGFPDWLLLKDCKKRTNDPVYLGYVKRYYDQLANHLQGLWFKDGGPIVGIQFDNELTNDEEHLRTLKQLAIEAGMAAPIYTATGWGGEGNAELPQDEMIPMFGGYPATPWDQNTREPALSMHYCFYHTRNDAQILPQYLYEKAPSGKSIDTIDISRYPYATCELGGGILVYDHRRPLLTGEEVAAISFTKLGNGNNLIGYYVFHGGSNPLGQLTTLNESRESKYPNDVPIISYDYQAAISEYGQLRPSYSLLKRMHLFVRDFGAQLATMRSYLPEIQPKSPSDTETLRYAVRTDGSSGFLFLNNYQREQSMLDKDNILISVELAHNRIDFPAIDLKNGVFCMLPFGLDLNGVRLEYATAQLLCQLELNDTESTWIFFAPEGFAKAEYVIDATPVASYRESEASAHQENQRLRFTMNSPGIDNVITLELHNGQRINLMTITSAQSQQLWKGNAWGKEVVVLSAADVLFDNEQLKLQSRGSEAIEFLIYPKVERALICGNDVITGEEYGAFTQYKYTLPHIVADVSAEQISLFRNAKMITSGDDAADGQRSCMHMRRSFVLEPGSPIRTAEFHFMLEGTISLWVNGVKVCTKLCTGHQQSVDVRQYLEVGHNVIAVRVRAKQDSGWLGRFEAERMNTARIIIHTDDSWYVSTEELDSWNSYSYPHANWKHAVNAHQGDFTELVTDARADMNATALWRLSVRSEQHPLLHDLILEINYAGDQGQIRLHDQLIADNYYNGSTWQVGLKRFLPAALTNDMELSITPLYADSYIYFDYKPKFEQEVLRELVDIRVIPEYEITIHHREDMTKAETKTI